MFKISSPFAESVTEGIHFQPETDLIAIGKNDKERHRYNTCQPALEYLKHICARNTK
jgi:hypothetical protein